MTEYLDEIQARADAATDGPWRPAALDIVDGFAGRGGIYYQDTLPLLLTTSGATVANLQFIAHARTDVPRLVAALRAVEALCAEADAAHEKYLAGVILDRFIVPANVTTERIRTAIRDALEAR